VDNHHILKTLIDNGAQSYASIQEKVAREAKLKLLDISPRQAMGWLSGPATLITQVAQFEMDVGGLGHKTVFAYVVPDQSEDLILGRAWLKDQGATINEKKDCVTFD
jgi:predicted aspartyl protease